MRALILAAALVLTGCGAQTEQAPAWPSIPERASTWSPSCTKVSVGRARCIDTTEIEVEPGRLVLCAVIWDDYSRSSFGIDCDWSPR